MPEDKQGDLPLDEWQTETRKIPTYQLNEKGELVIGEREVTERFKYTRPIPHKFCSEGSHFYEFVDGGRRQDGRVLVKCKRCSLGRVFIPGRHRLENGKLLPWR